MALYKLVFNFNFVFFTTGVLGRFTWHLTERPHLWIPQHKDEQHCRWAFTARRSASRWWSQWPCQSLAVFHCFYRASICEGGLGSRNSVRLSVCLSVCLSDACIVTKLNDALQIFSYHTKGQSLCYSDTKSGWSATPLSLWNLRSKWPTPFEKRRLRPISAHNVSTVGDSEKSSITTNIKSTRAFQRAIDGVRTLPLSALKGGSKSDFFRFLSKSQRLIVSSAVNFAGQCYKYLMVGGNIDHTHRVTVDKCM